MISVIIPVYHVEKYLKRCVDSVLKQTYSDWEMILVDDGGDDKCPQMCDEFAQMDERIRVLHKTNGGLSDARNKGKEIAVGDYITFLDSDDYIHPKMYEIMAGILDKKKDVDIVLCPFEKVEEQDDTMDERITLNNEYRILDHDRVICEMFSDNYLEYTVPWNKMYRKEMWENIEFPKGRIHEDEFTSHILLYNARKVGHMVQPCVCYRQRQGSIMDNVNTKECLDRMDAWKEKIEFFANKEKKAYALCLERTLTSMLWNYEALVKKNAKKEAALVRSTFLNIWKGAKKQKELQITKERKACFNTFCISEGTMKFYMKWYWKKMAATRKVQNKYLLKKGEYEARLTCNPQIASIEETLETIIETNASVSRYGDGEFKWMADIPQNSFQGESEEMKKRLIEIIKSEEDGHMVCLSDGFGKLDYLKSDARNFWYDFMGRYRKIWISYLKRGKKYYNTNMTRPYMDYQDKTPCEHRFDLLKKIWENREIILIEGEKSRLGIGNDLFEGAKSVRRILAPAVNAFDKYNEILEKAMEQNKDALYLIALGPTATILAYDLFKNGRQAIDVGHVDIEYEWFLRKVDQKIKIPNKYVNEVNAGNGVTENLEDEQYQSQIIAKIEL